MKNVLSGLGFLLVSGSLALAQTAGTNVDKSVDSNADISKNAASASLHSGLHLQGELQKTLDADKAKIGDEVLLKAKNDIKQNGQTVIKKGSTLVGKVTEIQKKTGGVAESKVGILFDALKQNGKTTPIQVEIMSVTSAATRAVVNDDLFAETSARSSSTASTSSRQSSGGLLGGVGNTVGNTVGGVVNTTTNTVGGVTNTAAETLGNTTQQVGGTISGLSISQSADASAESGTTLSMSGKNLRLEKGTMFNVAIANSAELGSGR